MTISRATFRRLSGYKWLVAAGVGAIVVAGCGSSSPAHAVSSTPSATSSTSATTTVEIRSVAGVGDVLTDSAGRALYINDQDTAGKIACTSSECTAIWVPLTVAKNASPTAPSQVLGKVTAVQRPDGASQVAFNGKPLYTFAFDHSAGVVTGNGAHDSFSGTNFTWHAATVTGTAATPPASTSPTTSSGY